MRVSRRIAAINLMEKIEKYPQYAKEIGVEVKLKKRKSRS